MSKRPPKAKVVISAYRDEVRKDLNKVKAAHIKSRQRVVANWSDRTRPSFNGRVTVTVGRLAIQIFAREKNPKKPIWKWLDVTGTSPHKIRPRPQNKSKRLFFRLGGRAKTLPNPPRFGTGRRAAGPLVVAREVNHPGFRPRRFSEKINKDLQPEALKGIRNGGRRGLRRAKRGG